MKKTAQKIKVDSKSKIPTAPQGDGFGATSKGKVWYGFYLLIIILSLVLGGYLYMSMVGKEKPEEQDNKVAEITTPTPQEINLSDYPIEVLNGSGVSGEASRVRDTLEDEGFTVSRIGNADSLVGDEGIISAKPGLDEGVIDAIKESLPSYVFNASFDLPESEGVDLIITIGTKTQ